MQLTKPHENLVQIEVTKNVFTKGYINPPLMLGLIQQNLIFYFTSGERVVILLIVRGYYAEDALLRYLACFRCNLSMPPPLRDPY